MTSFSSSDTNNNNNSNNNVTENENVNENDTVTTTSSLSSSSSSSSCSFHLVPKAESLTPNRCEKIINYARKRLQCTSGGNIPTTPMTPTTPTSLQIITHSQIQLGKLLGEGAFSSVYEIQSVKKQHRDLMLKQPGNVVVKFLRAKLYDNHGLFAASAADIVKEGKILATLCHVNVIRLHAISSSLGVDAYLQHEGGGCYNDGYFLVLEKLTQTLTTRIQEWQRRHTQLYTEYNSLMLVKQQQQQQQKQQQQQQQQQQDNDSIIVNTTPSVPSWRKRILLKTSRRSGTHNNDCQGSSSLVSSTSDDVSISSTASSAAASYFTSDCFTDADVDADTDVNADDDAGADDDADHCCAVWNTTTTSTTNITKEIEQLVKERIDASLQLAEAIHYLTTQNVMHRDLKPDNIGFDHQGILKVFDFDIARRCVPSTVVRPIPPPTRNGSNNIRNNKSILLLNEIDIANTIENQTFQYTHKVGSPRYMSPECAKRERYNLKTDVYSFALLFHQVLTLQQPYDDLEEEEHDHLVFDQGVRPVIPSELPLRIQQLLTQSWSPQISTRPTMQTICHILKEERKDMIRVGTPPSLVVSSSSPSLLLVSSMSYVSSCSFTAVSDINKKKNKKKEEKKKNTILFNINININSTTTSSSNNNGSKKKHKGRQQRRFLRPSSLTLFKRNSGGSSTTEKKNDSVVVPSSGPTKILNNNKLSSSSSSSYHHHGRRITHNNSNVSNAKAA